MDLKAKGPMSKDVPNVTEVNRKGTETDDSSASFQLRNVRQALPLTRPRLLDLQKSKSDTS